MRFVFTFNVYGVQSNLHISYILRDFKEYRIKLKTFFDVETKFLPVRTKSDFSENGNLAKGRGLDPLRCAPPDADRCHVTGMERKLLQSVNYILLLL